MTRERHHDLVRLLGGLLGRTRRRLAALGAAAVAGWGGGAVLVAAWVAGGEQAPSLSAAWGLGVSVGLLVALLVIHRLVLPLRGLAGPGDLVRRLERRGTHANLLVAAEESLRRPDRWGQQTPARQELRRRVREGAVARLAALSPADVADFPLRRTHAVAAAIALVAAAAGLLLAGGDLARGLGRLAAPWSVTPPVPTAGILALPAEPWLVAGSDVDLQALDLAGGPGLAVCEVRRGAGLWQPLPARLERDWARAPGRVWGASLKDVQEDFAWRFRRGSIVSPAREVIVRDHPLLVELAAVITPPAYTRVEPRRLERLPAWIEVPAGSRVDLSGRANNELQEAALAAAGDTVALAVDGRAVTGGLTIDRDTAFRIHLVDAWGLRNAAPVRHEIAAALDQAPAVVLERPGDDGLLPLEGELELVLDAAD
ncbi:MAG: DUF4175 family protein, partial [Candidatus Krumholzibacteriia bacterium]